MDQRLNESTAHLRVPLNAKGGAGRLSLPRKKGLLEKQPMMASRERDPKQPSTPLESSIYWTGKDGHKGRHETYFGFSSQDRWGQAISSTTLGNSEF